MKNATVKIRLVTPCISSGADQKQAEIRAQSIRGVLHFWFRALGGTLEREQRVFGRIGKTAEVRRSSLNVRVSCPADLRVSTGDCKVITGSDFDYFLWPLRDQSHSPGAAARGVIEAGQEFTLLLSHSRIAGGDKLPASVLKGALLLGSLGTRSRRCYGSLWPSEADIDGEAWAVAKDPAGIGEQVAKLVKGTGVKVMAWGQPADSWSHAVDRAAQQLKRFRCGSPKSGTPSKWGQNDHDVPLKGGSVVYRQALGLPLTQRYSDGKRWNSSTASGDRWASPLMLKVIPWGGKYQVVAVFLDKYVMKDGESIELKGRGAQIPSVRVSHDLWNEMHLPESSYYEKGTHWIAN